MRTLPTKKKVIVQVALTYLPDIGGGETHLRDLVSYISKYHDTVVITMKPYQSRKEKVPLVEKTGNVSVVRIPRPMRSLIYSNGKWRPFATLIYLPYFYIYVAFWSLRYKNAIIAFHLHGLLLAPLCVFLKRITGRKCIISVHFTFKGGGKILEEVVLWGLRRADHVLALSELEKENLIKLGIPREKVLKFTYWVDLESFKPIERAIAREKLGIDKSIFMVLFVGRLIEEKGIDIVLEVAKNMEKIEFYIIGDGPLREKVLKSSSEIKNLHYVGPVDNFSLPSWYSASNVLVVPSTSEEGFGRVIIEAFACGIPVIGSNLGGIPEAIQPHVGKIVSPNPQEFIKAISEVSKSSYSRWEIRKYAEERFGLKNAETILRCLIDY